MTISEWSVTVHIPRKTTAAPPVRSLILASHRISPYGPSIRTVCRMVGVNDDFINSTLLTLFQHHNVVKIDGSYPQWKRQFHNRSLFNNSGCRFARFLHRVKNSKNSAWLPDQIYLAKLMRVEQSSIAAEDRRTFIVRFCLQYPAIRDIIGVCRRDSSSVKPKLHWSRIGPSNTSNGQMNVSPRSISIDERGRLRELLDCRLSLAGRLAPTSFCKRHWVGTKPRQIMRRLLPR